MRNLKKFLALVLAMMMALSLMVTANAKGALVNEKGNGTNQYSDASTIDEKFVEAVDVLYGMGVMTGDYDKFKGDQYIMRSEMAAVLYRLMTGDTTQLKNQLYADQAANRFKDVPANAWYAPYVGWCYNAGIMVGSNGYFRPTANVTGYETLVMVLRAMGYGKNGEYTGSNWTIYAGADGTTVGLLKDVTNSHYGTTLSTYTRRDVVASIVFQGAQLPTVTYTPSLGYNKYIGVASAQGGNILNPSLGMTYFGLTSHYGIVVGNRASGEKGSYPTKIGFSVNPTISKGINVGQQTGVTTEWAVSGTLVSAEIVDDCDPNAYVYKSDMADAENVTLAFDWDTDLDLFNHKVKVWYDCRGTGTVEVGIAPHGTLGTDASAAYNRSTVTFGTNCKTYTLYDEAAKAWVNTAEWSINTATNDNDMDSVFGAGMGTFFNYAFAPMELDDNRPTAGVTMPANSAASPINNNNNVWFENHTRSATEDYPLYLAIDNTGNGNADVIISLNLTISQVTQDNDTQKPFTTGVLSANNQTTGTPYFDMWDQVAATVGGVASTTADYSNILNDKMVDSDDVKLYDYVAAVTVTGTTGDNNGKADSTATVRMAAPSDGTQGNAGKTDNFESTYYYKVDQLVTKETRVVRDYNQDTQEVYFEGGSFERSIFAHAVDGSFKGEQYVKAPTKYGTYTFYLDREGKYLFWEQTANTSNFVYGTYIDWETKLASGDFIYPMVYVNAKGEDQQIKNITKVDGDTMGTAKYNAIALPKRDNNDLNSSGFLPGTYIGYAMNDNGELLSVTDALDYGTGFFQATTNNFGTSDRTTVINKSGVAIGAVPVANNDTTGTGIDGTINNDNLYLTNATKFVVVNGAGTSTQKATVYDGLAAFLEDYESIEIDASTAPIAKTNGYLNNTDAGVPKDEPYKMVYYSLSNEIYDQIYDPSAKVVGTVFIPEQMLTRTAPVNGALYYVGDNTASVINEDDNATRYTMYHNGEKGSYWIRGLINDLVHTDEDADVIQALGKDVFYQLVDTGDTAHDGNKIYSLLPMTQAEADKQIIGRFYEVVAGMENKATPGVTAVNTTQYANWGYLATTRNAQIALIGAHTDSRNLYNVASANVVNLHTPAYTINSLQDLNGQSSLTSNQGVHVSCMLSGDHIVSLIYVNVDQNVR